MSDGLWRRKERVVCLTKSAACKFCLMLNRTRPSLDRLCLPCCCLACVKLATNSIVEVPMPIQTKRKSKFSCSSHAIHAREIANAGAVAFTAVNRGLLSATSYTRQNAEVTDKLNAAKILSAQGCVKAAPWLPSFVNHGREGKKHRKV